MTDDMDVIQTVLATVEGHKNEIMQLINMNANWQDRRLRLVENGLIRLETCQRELIQKVNHNQTDAQAAVAEAQRQMSTLQDVMVTKGMVLRQLLADAVKNKWFWAGSFIFLAATGPTLVNNWAIFVRVIVRA